MKRLLFSLIIILPLVGLFFSSEINAQPTGTGELPQPNKTNTTSSAGNSKTGPSVSGPPALAFGKEKTSKLDPRTSDKDRFGSLYEDLILKADSDDWLSFHIDNPALSLQILGKNNTEVAVRREPSGEFRIATQTGGLPTDGDYRVRVTGKSPAPFTIKVDRLGLTGVAYVERFRNITANFNDKDPASVEATIANLEKLGKDDPNRPSTFERLGIIHLQVRKDTAKAEWAMERAIKAKGSAIFQISFDNKWREMTKSRSGGLEFPDKRIGFLKIQGGKLTLQDAGYTTLATVSGPQIKELSQKVVSAYNLVTITTNNSRKPYIFAPEAMRQVEADLVVKLIQNYVVGRAVSEDRR